MKYMEKIFNTRNELILSLPLNMKIAEIGVFKGEFSKYIYQQINPSKLFLVDIFEGYMGSGDKDGNNMQYTNLSEEYEKLKNHFSNDFNVSIIKSKSSEFLSNIEDGYLDMVYIDGDHEYESVVSDLNLSYPKVKKGGFICGHDYVSPRFEGVVRAVNEFCKEKNLEIEYLTKDGCPTYCIIKK